jgi:hypothetical protein
VGAAGAWVDQRGFRSLHAHFRYWHRAADLRCPRIGRDRGKADSNARHSYATTLFDFISRGMPWTQPRSLTDDEVYALTAFILTKNKLIDDTDTMNAETSAQVKMPNRNGFIIRFPDKI